MTSFPIDPLRFVPDPVVQALVDHQRHTARACLCGWDALGASHAEHVASVIRPLIEAEVREELGSKWRDEGRAVMFNKAHDDLTPQQRVGKWLDDARIARGGAQ